MQRSFRSGELIVSLARSFSSPGIFDLFPRFHYTFNAPSTLFFAFGSGIQLIQGLILMIFRDPPSL